LNDLIVDRREMPLLMRRHFQNWFTVGCAVDRSRTAEERL